MWDDAKSTCLRHSNAISAMTCSCAVVMHGIPATFSSTDFTLGSAPRRQTSKLSSCSVAGSRSGSEAMVSAVPPLRIVCVYL